MKMPMISSLLFLLAFTFARSSTPTLAFQSKPDFSGMWKLDMSASDFGGPKTDLVYDGLTLTIAHHDPELKITRRVFKKSHESSQELVYFADGRGESNPALDGRTTVKSKTKWDGNKLTSKGSSRVTIPGSIFTIESIDRWELSSDGTTLVHSTESNLIPGSDRLIISPEVPRPIKRVFQRIP
jgi:hypothetical protein